TPQTLIKTGRGDYNTHFQAYGLGWFLKDIHGKYEVTHTGGLNGIVSQVTMIPDMDLGIIVLTNQQSGVAFQSITNSILDGYFQITDRDRINQYNERRLSAEKRADSIISRVEKNIKEQMQSSGAKLASKNVV